MSNKMNIAFPIVKAYSSQKYGLIIEDSNGVYHYWDFDGAYDGWSAPPETDFETQTNMN